MHFIQVMLLSMLKSLVLIHIFVETMIKKMSGYFDEISLK